LKFVISETFEVERSLLTCFKEGEPNLIICPQSKFESLNHSEIFDEPISKSFLNRTSFVQCRV
jgi:hypothetical protein